MRLPPIVAVPAAAGSRPPASLAGGGRTRRRCVRPLRHPPQVAGVPRPPPDLYDVVALRHQAVMRVLGPCLGYREIVAQPGAVGQVVELLGDAATLRRATVEIFTPHCVVEVGLDSIEIVRRSGWKRT